MSEFARCLVKLIERTRCDLSSEKAAQRDLEMALRAEGIAFAREVRLGNGEIIDFLVEPDGSEIGIEVKAKNASKPAALRQIARQLASPRLQGVILATNRAMGVPCILNGKPLFYASLGRGWL